MSTRIPTGTIPWHWLTQLPNMVSPEQCKSSLLVQGWYDITLHLVLLKIVRPFSMHQTSCATLLATCTTTKSALEPLWVNSLSEVQGPVERTTKPEASAFSTASYQRGLSKRTLLDWRILVTLQTWFKHSIMINNKVSISTRKQQSKNAMIDLPELFISCYKMCLCRPYFFRRFIKNLCYSLFMFCEEFFVCHDGSSEHNPHRVVSCLCRS